MGQLSRDVLESFQRKAYERSGLPVPSMEAALAQFPEVIAEVEQVTGGSWVELREQIQALSLPTPVQDPFSYGTIIELNTSLLRAGDRAGTPIPIETLIGTAPTGATNARTLSIPGCGDKIIVFDDGLFTFAWLCAKACAQFLPMRDREGAPRASTHPEEIWAKHQETDGVGMFRLRNATLAYMVRGNPASAMKYTLADPVETQLAINIATAWELFALAHEYGHILLRHPPGNRAHAHQDEFDADMFALRLVREATPSPSEAMMGAFLYLQCADKLERGLAYMHHGVDEPLPPVDSHPPPASRIEALIAAPLQVAEKSIVNGLAYALESLYWPTLVEAIGIAVRDRHEIPHDRWNARWA